MNQTEHEDALTDGPAQPKVVVIGTGHWGRNLVRNFDGLGALSGLTDLDPSTRAAFAGRYPAATVYENIDAVLADPVVDAVAIATPAETHYAVARAAVEAGKDVFVEKPLALTADEGRALVDYAQRQGRVLMVGHLLRFHPAVRKIGELIEEGAVGQLRYIYSNRLNFGKIRTEENILWSFAPHDISLILHLVGAAPSHVQATGGSFLNPHVADVTLTHLEFQNGVRAHVHVSWLHPYKDQRLVVIGDRGMVVFDDQKPWSEKLSYYQHVVDWVDRQPVAQKAEGRPITVAEEEPLRNECEHFVRCVSSRGTPLTDGREGLAVLEVLAQAQRSLNETHDAPRRGISTPAERRTDSVKFGDDVRIHPTVEIDGPVEIGDGSRVWHFSKLLGPLTIGKRCNLGQNVVVERHVTLGNNVKVQNNVSIYSGVVLEDDVFCGPSMVFTNVGTPRSHYPRRGQYEATHVGRGASIGANATVVCGNRVGRYAFVGAGSVVTRDVPDYGLVYGNPARLHGWSCYCGDRLQMGVDTASETSACGDCGRVYAREGHRVTPTED